MVQPKMARRGRCLLQIDRKHTRAVPSWVAHFVGENSRSETAAVTGHDPEVPTLPGKAHGRAKKSGTLRIHGEKANLKVLAPTATDLAAEQHGATVTESARHIATEKKDDESREVNETRFVARRRCHRNRPV
jgi:hypothetical protein